MKQHFTSFLALVLLTLLSLPLSAQPSGTSVGQANNIVMMGTPVMPGEHVANELIIYYPLGVKPSARPGVEAALLAEGLIAEEWSPSGRYLRVTDPALDACTYQGTGNPRATTSGQGEQIGLNYIMGTTAWIETAAFDCNAPEDGASNNYYDGYFPGLGCVGEEKLLPATGRNDARIAIIDSGVRGVSSSNGTLQQIVVPGSCNDESCQPYPPSFAETQTFHPHGTYIASLIKDWFLANDLEPQLSISSYQVLNQDLQCTLFQVIKAIELATAAPKEARPHILSLSIGFRPLFCVKDPSSAEDKTEALPSLLYGAIDAAQQEGIMVITSAGNNGNDLAVAPQYPAAEEGLNNLVTVGAMQCTGTQRADWSNYSDQHVDLFTTGSIVKVISASCYINVYGTSFACPIVAAKAAFQITEQEVYGHERILCDLRSQALPESFAIYGVVDADANAAVCTAEERHEISTGGVISNTTISPNPFTDQVSVSLPTTFDDAPASLTIFSANGKAIVHQTTRSPLVSLDLSELSHGVYWLRVVTSKGAETHTLVKQK